ncbi:MAG: hypothetical protein H8K07_01600 [Nitrospira sp.]|nr:hypothetical protein [Nitrospira sp.]
MEIGALVLALINLVLAVLDDRRATRPEREAKAERKDAIDDVAHFNHALRKRDADGVAAFFERERLEAWGRIDAPVDHRDSGSLRARGDDSGQPQTGGQS